MGGVDSSKRSVGNSMTNSSIGGSNSGIGIGTIASMAKTSSIWVSTIGSIVSISFRLSLSLSLLPSTGDRGTKVVCADAYVGGVGETSRGGSNSVDRVGDTSSVAEASIAKTSSIAKSSIAKTSIGVGTIASIANTSGSIGVSTIGSIVGISFRLSLGLPLLSAVDTIGVSTIGTCVGVAIGSIGISIGNTTSTGDRHVSGVYTGGTLETSIGNSVASIAIGGIVGVSICLSISSSHKDGGNNKE